MNYKLGDDVIVELRNLIQICMLTGTNVIDHLRMVRLESNNDEVNLTDDYRRHAADNIEKLIMLANEMIEVETEEPVTPEEREFFDQAMHARHEETGE